MTQKNGSQDGEDYWVHDLVGVRPVEWRGQSIPVVELALGGPVMLKLPRYVDDRGTFMETYSAELFARAGLPTQWSQDNTSFSKQGVIRGMHFQDPIGQGKLVSCMKGKIQDVAIDLRPESEHYGRIYSVILEPSAKWNTFLYVPVGFAHGFQALYKSAVSYKCTTPYAPQQQRGINPLASNIPWIPTAQPWQVAPKDLEHPSLMDYMKRRG